MLARQYLEFDYTQISHWFMDRKMNPPSRLELPSIGFIVDDYCEGFLIRTDTNTAIIDFMVTNPKADKLYRKQAMDKVVKALISMAKRKNFHKVKCDSQIPSIKEKAIELGFTNLGSYDSFYKEI